ncbi:Heterokaryon incompatibility protein (HET) domain containing protein, partial [Hyaloscypha variabilis]
MTSLESSLKPYTHKHLESQDTIRILCLYPAQSHSDPLEFDLEHRARSELLTDCSETALHYDAVSYVWGTPVFPHSMYSRQQATYLKITPSVNSFLHQFRKKAGARLLWVDAICLDQKNDDEKSEQVPLMGEIYSQARKVRIWLGEGNENTNKAFKFLSLVAVMKRKNGTLSHALFMEALFKIFASESVQALEGILCDPWFGRRWIIQEAVLGHSVIVHQGSHKISWELFTEGLIALLDVVSDLQLSDVGRYSLISTNTMLSARTRDILDCLWDFDKNVCSDERDRLFALYGFTPSSNTNDQGAPPAVEYNHSWPEVYSDFAALTIEKKGLSSILPHLIAFGGLSESNP